MFNRPTLTQIVERGRADVETRLPGADSRLRRSPLDVLVTVQAGAVHGLYGYLDWISRQVMPDTAEGEYLRRWASIWGLTPKSAEASTGTATITGANGAFVPAGEVLQRSDGVEYIVQAAATISAGTGTIALQAAEPGRVGNAVGGQLLAFVSPIDGVAANAAVVSGLTGGADEESDPELLGRLLQRIQQPPLGGAQNDYERWALEVPGVTRAWVYPSWMGPGTVGVTFVMDGRDDIIPTEANLDAVEAWIAPRRPVTAAVTVFAPEPRVINMTITISPTTDAVKAAVVEELRDLIVRDGEPGGVILVSRINEHISIAAGEADHILVSPAGNVEMDPGELPILGTVTWTA